jgi:hypothetical protein
VLSSLFFSYRASLISAHLSILFYSIRYLPSLQDKLVTYVFIVYLSLSLPTTPHLILLSYVFHLFFFYVPHIRKNVPSLPFSILYKLFNAYPPDSAPKPNPSIKAITQMGFSIDQAAQALRRHNNDLSAAINSLLDE